jgi:hypothetical protein
LADIASKLLGKQVAFELSVLNVDKPALTASEIRRRLQQFSWRAPVWVTRTPTFAEKAALFPGAVFVIGADTAERIIAPRYYQESQSRMAESLDYIRRQGCRFLVAARQDGSGKPIALSDLILPAAHGDLFSGIDKSDFHMPISSTVLRQQVADGRPTVPLEEAE